MSDENNKTNDYAIAHALNIRAWQVLWHVADLYPLYDEDRRVVNRNYIVLVHELEKLYDQNKELQDIEPKPTWQLFNLIDGNEPHIIELQDDRTGDTGQAHTAKVERLCILAGVEEPIFTAEQKGLVMETDKIIATLTKFVDKEKAYVEASKKKKHDWYISEYTLSYNYGTILINGVLKIKKAHDGSALDSLMLQSRENPNKIFSFTPKKPTKRTVSTILSSAGFTSTLRQLFFPETGKSRGVLFRPSISSDTTTVERIDTANLDLQLKELGAITSTIDPS